MGEGWRTYQDHRVRTQTCEYLTSVERYIRVDIGPQTYEHIRTATLDVEERRIILNIPPFYSLDVDVSLPDAQLVSIFGSQSGDDSVLMLKRQRDFDVDGAQAAWRVADGVVTIHV